MKKNIRRIIELVLLLIGVYHNCCYADIITGPTTTDSIGIFMIPIAIIVIVISLLSIVILHFSAKDNKQELINKDKRHIAIAIILAGIGLDAIFGYKYNLSLSIFPIIFSIILLILDKKKSEKTKIFYIIDICLIILILVLEIAFGHVSRGGELAAL